MITNIVNHIGNKVNVWHKTGNALENRTLLTVDEFGISVTAWTGAENYSTANPIFVPWQQINYVDLIQQQEEKKVNSEEAINTAAEFLNGEWDGHLGVIRSRALIQKIASLLNGGNYRDE